MVSSSQIRERLMMFLDGRIDLDAFEDWLVQNTWNVHLSGSRSAEALTFAIEESLSEYSSHHLTEPELRRELLSLVHSENKAVDFRSVADISWEIVTGSPTRVLAYAQP